MPSFPLRRRRSVAVASPSPDEQKHHHRQQGREDDPADKPPLRRSSFSFGHNNSESPSSSENNNHEDKNDNVVVGGARASFVNFFRKNSHPFTTGSDARKAINEANVSSEKAIKTNVIELTLDIQANVHPTNDLTGEEQQDSAHHNHNHNHQHEHHHHPQIDPKHLTQHPLTIQDALELKIDAGIEAAHEDPVQDHHHHHHPMPSSLGECDLTNKDVKALFSGAPHFLLERARDSFHPQVIFPWDEHNISIQNMLDRRPLAHRAFAASTMHAHLPIIDEVVRKAGNDDHSSSFLRHSRGTDDDPEGTTKRPVLDIGMFEVPNMLAMSGQEPGSVGFRYFLEIPVADAVKCVGPGAPRLCNELRDCANAPASVTFEILEHRQDPYSECRNGTVHSREQLLCSGPTAWKRIGVRDVEFATLVDRLERLRMIRQECLYEPTGRRTILDYESPRQMENFLFSTFLHHPPERIVNTYVEDPHSLKSQIRVLISILAIPGAWFDFSLVEERFRSGQVLWEAPPHPDGFFLDPQQCELLEERPWISTFLERKWFFFQMLLAAELLQRLDAVARTRSMGDRFALLDRDVRLFNEMRTHKVNWDLVVVRRFLDNFSVSCARLESESSSPVGNEDKNNEENNNDASGAPLERHHTIGFFNTLRRGNTNDDNNNNKNDSSGAPLERHHSRGLFDTLRHKLSSPVAASSWSSWLCELAPFHMRRQLEGLFVFAEEIGWPNLDSFKDRMMSRVVHADDDTINKSIFKKPIRNVPREGDEVEKHVRTPWCFPVHLHLGEEDDEKELIGGWMTRSWLSGFILPGDSSSHLLMTTVLENDPEAMAQLGPVANLYGGFAYDRHTWWSKLCVVSRVVACLDGSKECMGWVRCDIVPIHAITSRPFGNTWFEVATSRVQKHERESPRVEQGSKVIRQSLPLGVGAISGDAFTLPTDKPEVDPAEVEFVSLALVTEERRLSATTTTAAKANIVGAQAIASFRTRVSPEEDPKIVSLPLAYNVYFISSYECRPPLGHALYSSDRGRSKTTSHQDRTSKSPSPSPERVPGHPLHSSYHYKVVPLASLPETEAPPPLHSEEREQQAMREQHELKNRDVLIIDARGSKAKEAFARAWCAYAGTSAVVGRVGRTCLSCCVREAHATNVGVVIRVGDC